MGRKARLKAEKRRRRQQAGKTSVRSDVTRNTPTSAATPAAGITTTKVQSKPARAAPRTPPLRQSQIHTPGTSPARPSPRRWGVLDEFSEAVPTDRRGGDRPNGYHAVDVDTFDEPVQRPVIVDLARWLDEFGRVDRPISVDRPPSTAKARALALADKAKLPHAGRILDILDHLDRATESLSSAVRLAAADAADPDSLFATEDLHQNLIKIVDRVQMHQLLFEESLRIAAEDEPLAVAYRHGERWGGKLNPRQIARLAEQARPGTPHTTYLAGRTNHVLTEATALACPVPDGRAGHVQL
jgi:hypothetical protein